MFHIFALAWILHIFARNLTPYPYGLANIFRAYLGQVNRWKTTNLKPLYTKLLCMVLGGTLGSSTSAHLSRPQGFTVVTCLVQAHQPAADGGMGLPKPTRLSFTQFPNSCSSSQSQSQWLPSCIDHLFKDKLDLNHTGIFLARVQNLINLYQVWERATYPDKMTASHICFAALADCWAVTQVQGIQQHFPLSQLKTFSKTQSTLSFQQTLGSLALSVTSETPSKWSPFFSLCSDTPASVFSETSSR